MKRYLVGREPHEFDANHWLKLTGKPIISIILMKWFQEILYVPWSAVFSTALPSPYLEITFGSLILDILI